MNIYSKPGSKVVFTEKAPSDSQVNWGSHADPTGLLVVGKTYTIDHTAVHSSYTKVFLEGFPGKHFNSVWFEDAEVNG